MSFHSNLFLSYIRIHLRLISTILICMIYWFTEIKKGAQSHDQISQIYLFDQRDADL